MKTAIPTLLGLCLLLTSGAAAQAQPAINNPPITPYLNLYRPGYSAAQNYLTMVRPDFDFRSSILAVQQQTRANQQAIADYQPTGPLVTGHVAGFMTQNSYFQTVGIGGVGSGGSRYGATSLTTGTPRYSGGLTSPGRGATSAPSLTH